MASYNIRHWIFGRLGLPAEISVWGLRLCGSSLLVSSLNPKPRTPKLEEPFQGPWKSAPWHDHHPALQKTELLLRNLNCMTTILKTLCLRKTHISVTLSLSPKTLGSALNPRKPHPKTQNPERCPKPTDCQDRQGLQMCYQNMETIGIILGIYWGILG